MNEELLSFIRKNTKNFDENAFVEQMLRLSLIVCDKQCLIPPSFLMENERNLQLAMKYKCFFETGIISLLLKESNIEFFFRKKEREYLNKKNETSYSGYFDESIKNSIRELYHLSNTIRPFHAGHSIAKMWESDLLDNKCLIGFDINETEKVELDMITSESMVNELEGVIYDLEDKAFIWENISNLPDSGDRFKQSVWRSTLLYYIKSHIEGIDCTVIESDTLKLLKLPLLKLKNTLHEKDLKKEMCSINSEDLLNLRFDNFTKFLNSKAHIKIKEAINKQSILVNEGELDIGIKSNDIYLGEPPTKETKKANLLLPIYADGLNKVDSNLILSCLPEGASGAYLRPLQKGLSGANVYAVTVIYDEGRRRSKTYVAKIGDANKLRIENSNYEKYVQPFLTNYAISSWRECDGRFVLFLEFKHYDTKNSNVSSLKELISSDLEFNSVLKNVEQSFRLLDNLKKRDGTKDKLKYSEIIEWYVSIFEKEKVSFEQFKETYGRQYRRIFNKVLPDFINTYNTLREKEVEIQQNIIHGDFHAENIIIDSDHISWLIDFYWTSKGDPVLDYVMLEISIKFYCIPHSADINDLIYFEEKMINRMWHADFSYRKEFANSLHSTSIITSYKLINRIRKEAKDKCGIHWSHYRNVLFLISCSQLNKSRKNTMNMPFVISSLGLLTNKINRSREVS